MSHVQILLWACRMASGVDWTSDLRETAVAFPYSRTNVEELEIICVSGD